MGREFKFVHKCWYICFTIIYFQDDEPFIDFTASIYDSAIETAEGILTLVYDRKLIDF